ncbi:MAG: VWA domain-containing protein [Crocinitomicaceae bacterium]|nr:VWA domain-containing protein [Crocinitomicaceae bacterium]
MKSIILSILSLFIGYSAFSQMYLNSSEISSTTNVIGNSYDVHKIRISAVIENSIARTTVTQTIKNTTDHDLEVEFFFPLPANTVIQDFTMMVNGQEIPGKLLKKEEAKNIYESIVRQHRDPALMEFVGYNLFKTSVFPIRVGEERNITVNYSQVVEKKNGSYQYSYPLGTQKFSQRNLKNVEVDVRIKSKDGIKTIFSPTYDVHIDRKSDKDVRITKTMENTIPDQDFKLQWNSSNDDIGTQLISYYPKDSDHGYFLLIASPSMNQRVEVTHKNIVFVIDKSGSMSGQKLAQSKNAMKYVLNHLNEGDKFNIVVYSDYYDVYSNGLISYTEENKLKALEYVESIKDDGGTNINLALKEGLQLFGKKDSESNAYETINNNPNYILFLTDGLPTVGEKNEAKIAANVKEANKYNAHIFCFGVGNDVNSRLLDRISSENGALTEYVKPNESIESVVSSLYTQISSPVMTDISLKFNSMKIQQDYPKPIPDLFKGGQLMLAGQYKVTGKTTLNIMGKVGGKEHAFEFPVEFLDAEHSTGNEYVETFWASKRIGYLINQIDLYGKSDELINELVALSTKHGILTPYTAFLAKENTDFRANQLNIQNASNELDNLNNVQGGAANATRQYKNKLMNSQTFGADEFEELQKDADYDGVGGKGFITGAADKKEEKRILNVSGKTFYKEKDTWIESNISKIEQDKAVVIKKYTKEYFDISNQNSASMNQVLSLKGNVIVNLNGKIYNFQE